MSKRFFGIVKGNKKFRSTMTFSKYILNFDEDYFGILKDELRYLIKDIRETFVDNFFVFSLVDVHIEKMIFEMLPSKVYCHCFYCRSGSRLFGWCDVCSRFFVDDQDIAKKFDVNFVVTKKTLRLYPVGELMELVNANAAILNIYYLIAEYQSKTKNFGEVFFEIVKNSFGVYVFMFKST